MVHRGEVLGIDKFGISQGYALDLLTGVSGGVLV